MICCLTEYSDVAIRIDLFEPLGRQTALKKAVGVSSPSPVSNALSATLYYWQDLPET